MKRTNNIQLAGASGRPFLLDLIYQADGQAKPIVIFAHGFKGFKDWGHWHLIAERFAEAGFVFVKFNFSHNGTTLARPEDFDDLEAFGQNNYSKELTDLQAVLAWLHRGDSQLPAEEADLNRIYLIGHSRGGPIVLLQALEDERIRSVATWASVASLAYAWKDQQMIADWEKKGAYHVVNGRTGQEMPIYYQMYQDYMARREYFDLPQRLPQLQRPALFLHGTEDPAVPHAAAEQLQRLAPGGESVLIEGADHVFGGSHPFTGDTLPEHSQQLVEHTIGFFQ